MAGLLPGLPALAQDRPAPQGPPLSLQAALDEALERNPTLVALRRDYDTARTRPAQAGFLPPPMFEAQIWQWPINTLNPANANMYMFMLSQELPGRGKRDLRSAVLEKDAAIADADIAVRARAVVDEVKRTYADLFLARKTVELTRANIDLLRQFADVSQAKYATGRVSQQDVLKAIVELSRAHETVVELEERARLTEAALDTLLGRPPDGAIGPLAEPRASVTLPPASALQARAISEQPGLSAVRLSIEQAEASLAATESDYKPDFVVQGGYMLMPDMTDAWMAKVGISWPKAPWSRGRVEARVSEARAEIDARRARLAAAESMVRLAVQQAYVRVQSAVERARILETSLLPQASQVLDVSRAAYQTDRVDFLSLVDNQRQLLDLRIEYFRARTEVELAWADLERAVGVDLGQESQAPAPAAGAMATVGR